jgi:UDP-N-acetylmuramate--alanine ligase
MIVPVPDSIEPAAKLGRVHFVGVGGAALSGLARIMAQLGIAVSGSDAADTPMLESLRALGIRTYVGHRSEQVEGADVVVVSTAIRDDNPEVLRARELGIVLWPRAAAVQSVMLGRRSIVVTGTHGKTTTTAMLATALIHAGADPSYAIGSTLIETGLNAAIGSGEEFVAEGDESDAAILAYTPVGAVVTNIEADHLDFFKTADAYMRVFDDFLGRIEPGGFLVCCVDDAGARRLADSAEQRGINVVRVGLEGGPGDRDFAARIMTSDSRGTTYQVLRGADADGPLGEVRLSLPGTHYVLDSLAALAAGIGCGYDVDRLAAGLAAYRGSGRRMELKGAAGGVAVYDSYAHHPTEIRGDLEAARVLVGDGGTGRVVVCFQPHLFSRTRIFGAEMGAALGAADEVVVMDVYRSRELPEPGVDGSIVAAAVPLPPEHVVYEPDWGSAAVRVVERVRPGDLVLTLGAGDVTEIGPRILAMLEAAASTDRGDMS